MVGLVIDREARRFGSGFAYFGQRSLELVGLAASGDEEDK